MNTAGREEGEKEASPWLSSSFGETSSQNHSSLQHPGDESGSAARAHRCHHVLQLKDQGKEQVHGDPSPGPQLGRPGTDLTPRLTQGTPRVSSLKQPQLTRLSECPRTPLPSQDAATGERGGIFGRPQASCSPTEGPAGLLSPQTWLGLPPRGKKDTDENHVFHLR